MESFIRKIVWLFQENKAVRYAAACITVLLVGGGIVLVVSRSRKLQGNRVIVYPTQGNTLRQLIANAHKRATDKNILQPLGTQGSFIVEENNIPFLVNVLNEVALTNKEKAGTKKVVDAFEHVDDSLRVTPLSPTHHLVLNKFPIIKSHVVIITEPFLPQNDGLSIPDMEALWALVSRVGGLGFYNCGKESGSSQPRRHTQFIPFDAIHAAFPDGMQTWMNRLNIPMDMAVQWNREAHKYGHFPGEPFSLELLPYKHSVCMLGGDALTTTIHRSSKTLHAYYIQLLKTVFPDWRAGWDLIFDGTAPAETFKTSLSPDVPPHNVLLTPHWMMVIPRTVDVWNGMPINAMAFAGFLLARPAQVDNVRRVGPLQILRDTTTITASTITTRTNDDAV